MKERDVEASGTTSVGAERIDDLTLPALHSEVARLSGVSWDEAVSRVRASLLDAIEDQYRRAFLRLVADDDVQAVQQIGRILEKSDSQIAHWQNPSYGAIGFVTIWQGFAALDQVITNKSLPRGRLVVREGAKSAIAWVCINLLKAREWNVTHEVALLEMQKVYWDEARMKPALRGRAVKQLLRSIQTFTGKKPRWTFEQVDGWRRIWDAAWMIYRSGDNFSWAQDDGTT